MNKNRTPSKDWLDRVFAEEFQRAGRYPIPECEIHFYRYRGLTNTIRARDGRIIIRMSDLLADAPPDVLRSILAILIHKLYGSPVAEEDRLRYKNFVDRPPFRELVRKMRSRRGRKRLTSPRGKVYDLRDLYQELNEAYFESALTIRQISWSQRANRTTLGHFDAAHETIIINRGLDNRRVPEYVVSYVLYHEMLHAFLGEELAGKGPRIHHQRFQEAERKFKDYSRAKAFIRDRFHRLIARIG